MLEINGRSLDDANHQDIIQYIHQVKSSYSLSTSTYTYTYIHTLSHSPYTSSPSPSSSSSSISLTCHCSLFPCCKEIPCFILHPDQWSRDNQYNNQSQYSLLEYMLSFPLLFCSCFTFHVKMNRQVQESEWVKKSEKEEEKDESLYQSVSSIVCMRERKSRWYKEKLCEILDFMLQCTNRKRDGFN